MPDEEYKFDLGQRPRRPDYYITPWDMHAPSRPEMPSTTKLPSFWEWMGQKGIGAHNITQRDYWAREYEKAMQAERQRQNPFTKDQFGNLAGPGNQVMQALQGQTYGTPATGEWAQAPDQALAQNAQTYDAYRRMSDEGMMSPGEISGITDMARKGNQAAMDALKQSSDMNESRALRGMRSTNRNMSPGQRDRRVNDLRAQHLMAQAAMNAQGVAQAESYAPRLTEASLMTGRQLGPQGMGASTQALAGMTSDRLWDQSYENKFGPTPAQQAMAGIPGQMLQGPMAEDADYRRAELDYTSGSQRARDAATFGQKATERNMWTSAWYNAKLAELQSKLKQAQEQGNWMDYVRLAIDIGKLAL